MLKTTKAKERELKPSFNQDSLITLTKSIVNSSSLKLQDQRLQNINKTILKMILTLKKKTQNKLNKDLQLMMRKLKRKSLKNQNE